jgi:hypothetical protein
MRNQCDGCKRGIPPVDGIHKGEIAWNAQGCTADRYAEPKDSDQELTGERESSVCDQCGEHVPEAWAMDAPRDSDAWVHIDCPTWCP